MKALILAGGRGTRLRPVTDYLPKPLIPIRNVPLIEWQVRYLRRHGIGEVIVCSGYRTEMIENHLGMKRDLAGGIRFSVERSPLGTGGAIKRAARTIDDESFVVINGDVLTDIDLGRLTSVPNSVASVPLRTRFGTLTAEGGLVTGFREKGEVPGLWMNAGIYHLRRDVVGDLPARGNIEETLFPDYAARGKLREVRFGNAVWHSVDSFKDMEESALDVDKMIK